MLGKSVLPRVLIRVTLLLPAHLPVLIGQRVSHSGGCWVMSARETDQTTTLCVQEVEIYLERWEVLGALVDVCVERRKGS